MAPVTEMANRALAPWSLLSRTVASSSEFTFLSLCITSGAPNCCVISRKKAADTGSLLTHFICLALGLLSMKQMERNCIISRVEWTVSCLSIQYPASTVSGLPWLQGILSKVILQFKYMKLCYLNVHIWDIYCSISPKWYSKNCLILSAGGSLECVEVKYTTHSQGILSKVILQ